MLLHQARPAWKAWFGLEPAITPELRKNVQIEYYEAGHMMYVRDDDRVKLSRDVRDFIRRR